jgi:hypothetical protein
VRRRVLIGAAMLLLLSVPLCAQSREKKAEEATAPRDLTGVVFDKAHQRIPGAIVYLKNTRSLAINTYITVDDGSYRFNHLSPDVEYQVRAESNGHKSDVKTLGSFDTHKRPHINLKLGK